MSFIKKHWFILLILILFLWIFTWAYSSMRTAVAYGLAAAAAVIAMLQPGALAIVIAAYLWAGIFGLLSDTWYSIFGTPSGAGDLSGSGFSLPAATDGGAGG